MAAAPQTHLPPLPSCFPWYRQTFPANCSLKRPFVRSRSFRLSLSPSHPTTQLTSVERRPAVARKLHWLLGRRSIEILQFRKKRKEGRLKLWSHRGKKKEEDEDEGSSAHGTFIEGKKKDAVGKREGDFTVLFCVTPSLDSARKSSLSKGLYRLDGRTEREEKERNTL